MSNAPCRSACVLALLLAAACQSSPPAAQNAAPAATTTGSPPKTREQFAAAFASIHPGMSADAARALLGPPHDIRTQADPDVLNFTDMREIWCYGADSHLALPTLGSLSIDIHNHVQYISATRGAADLVAAIGEPEVRRLLRVIDAASAPGLTGPSFHPRETLAAINALQPLGQKTGVALMQEYLHVDFGAGFSHDAGIFAVMRGLFEPPPSGSAPLPGPPYSHVAVPGHLRPPAIGAVWIPEDLNAYPLFPLVLVHDLPFVPWDQGGIGGRPESPLGHLTELDREATWRTKALAPPDDPLAPFAELTARVTRDGGLPERRAAAFKAQLLHLLETVYPDPLVADPDLSQEEIAAAFDKALPQIAAMHLRWDAAACAYVRGDGTFLQPAARPVYARTILHPRLPGFGGAITLVVERTGPRYVRINVNVTDADASSLNLRITSADISAQTLLNNPASPRSSLSTEGSGPHYSSSGYRLDLLQPRAIRIDLAHGHDHFQSEPIQP